MKQGVLKKQSLCSGKLDTNLMHSVVIESTSLKNKYTDFFIAYLGTGCCSYGF